jgi:hypothetical protein
MAGDRHVYVPFYMSDWLAGTSRMTRLVRSVYFDICLYNWDKMQPVPDAELMLMLADIAPQGDDIVSALIGSGKLKRDERGVYQHRALAEAEKAFDLWFRKSQGGKTRTGGGKPAGGEHQDSSESRGENRAEQNRAEQKEDGESDDSHGGEAPPNARRTYDSQSVINAWNEMAQAAGLTQMKKLTEERRKRLRARIEEHGEPALIEGINLIPSSPFLMGGGERGWKANFDWMLRPEQCAKLIEGAFHNGGEGRPSGWREP